MDVAVGFGSRCAPFSFSTISTAAAWVVQRRLDAKFGEVSVATTSGVTRTIPRAAVFCLMDDFATISNADIAAEVEQIMTSTLTELGLPTQPLKDKHHGPEGKYLGWWIDTRYHGRTSLPWDKRDPWRAELLSIAEAPPQGKTSTKQLERQVGRLTHAHLAHRRSRPHIDEMLRLIRKQSSHPLRITDQLRTDCRHWAFALAHHPYCSFTKITDPNRGHPTGPWACGDASGAGGFGFFDAQNIYYDQWGPDLAAHLAHSDPEVSSTLQETACYAAAVLSWLATKPSAGTTFTYFTDAKNVYYNWARGRSQTVRVNNILRLLPAALLRRDCHTRVVWQSRTVLEAKAADLLSRAAAQETFADQFRELCPSHPGLRTTIPRSIITTILASTRK